jgi:RNA polymerase-interacting CarD/CdnL/TRCF family regulator
MFLSKIGYRNNIFSRHNLSRVFSNAQKTRQKERTRFARACFTNISFMKTKTTNQYSALIERNKRLDELRTKWRNATSLEERQIIEQEARLLKGETKYQCYYINENGKRCKKEQFSC